MKRLYIILSIIIISLVAYVAGLQAKVVSTKEPVVTDKAVQEREQAYVDCINKDLNAMQKAFGEPMSGDTAKLNTVKIVKGCDNHLRDIMIWLQKNGEKKSKINNWANGERRYFLNQVYNVLTEGSERSREHRNEGSN